MGKRRKGAQRKEQERKEAHKGDEPYEFGDPNTKNWGTPCQVCDALPTVMDTGLCGPCCFGEAETAGGNW